MEAHYSYEHEFKVAMNRAVQHGLSVPDFKSTTRRYLTPETARRVVHCVQRAAGHLTARDVSAQCFAFHLFLRESLEEAVGVGMTYTLGYVRLEGKPVFYTPQDELERLLERGVDFGAALNLHAWLTLPSHELIDLTFATTYGIVRNDPDCEGRSLFLHPDDMRGMSYHPQWIGESYMRRMGVLLEFDTA